MIGTHDADGNLVGQGSDGRRVTTHRVIGAKERRSLAQSRGDKGEPNALNFVKPEEADILSMLPSDPQSS